MPKKLNKENQLSDLLGPEALKLLTGNSADFIRQIGFDVIRGILLDILTGKNVRDSTEALTRGRIAALNIALTSFFLRNEAQSPGFIKNLPQLASNVLTKKRISKSERWLANWMLGLTGKSFQNVLRDNKTLIDTYRDRYIETCEEIIAKNKAVYGELTGTLKLSKGISDEQSIEYQEAETQIDWLWLLYLLNTIGSQTLTIRGSEKSSYGKLFEKLVLGSLLSILGFQYEPSRNIGEGVFWLSTQGEKRESDATLLYKLGQGVRFDIGFIGRGNSEISLDKVSRFQRQEEIRGRSWYMATIIIVDRLGEDSKVAKQAKEINGDIVQMSASYWPQEVANLLKTRLQLEHELANMKEVQIEDYLKERLQMVPIESFINTLPIEEIVGEKQLSFDDVTEDNGI
jgi:hypothetical protein